jgi:hypothetical protein
VTSDWHSIHVYYYDADKDALILDGVRPLFRRLAGQVDTVSFTRHWRQGPHLRLNMFVDIDTLHSVVRPAVDAVVGEFLANRPSRRLLDPGKELAAHRRLAELEEERGPLWPWYPDNSIRVAAYDRREEVVGGPAMADLLADFQARTTQFAFRAIEATAGVGRRALAFDLMIATAHAFARGGLANGFLSFRSHAESFLHVFAEAHRLRNVWDAHYRAHAAEFVERLGVVTTALDQGALGDWVRALEPYRAKAAALLRSGELRLPFAGSVPAGAELSSFHQALYEHPQWPATLASVGFQQYRLVLNLTYLCLTRIGITPVERFFLSHMAANAAEDTYGVSAVDLIIGAAR